MTFEPALIQAGEEIRSQVRYTREQITQFARLTGDTNPLHGDQQAAERLRFGEICVSCEQITSQMMGTLSSHCARTDDGELREVMVREIAFSFHEPLFAGQVLDILWRVTRTERSREPGALIAHLEGQAVVGRQACASARATLWLRVRATQRPA